MYKELVLVKDINNFWSCALCHTCTHDKDITNIEEALNIIKSTYSTLSNAEFVIEGNDVFVLLNDPLTPINIQEGCE